MFFDQLFPWLLHARIIAPSQSSSKIFFYIVQNITLHCEVFRL
jgi:hypothetical protein